MSEHVVILQHGVGGQPGELVNIFIALHKACPHAGLRVVLSDVNHGKTMDGVAAGGSRLAALIRSEVCTRGSRLSLIGHSLGGLYARYALRRLEEQGWFEEAGVRPTTFITLATPHLGIHESNNLAILGICAAGRCAPAHCRTAVDLALHRDILFRLVDAVSLASLRRFERLVAYGNLVNDFTVKPCTSMIIPESPLGSVFVDPHQKVPLQMPPVHMTGEKTLSEFTSKYRGQVRGLLEQLLTLPWERYAVYFPGCCGEAHVQICNHAFQDKHKDGVRVVAHLAEVFLAEERNHKSFLRMAKQSSRSLRALSTSTKSAAMKTPKTLELSKMSAEMSMPTRTLETSTQSADAASQDHTAFVPVLIKILLGLFLLTTITILSWLYNV